MAQGGLAGPYDAIAPNPIPLRRTQSGLEAVGGSPPLATAQKRAYTLRLPPDPVHVEGVDGSEALRYRPADMVAGRLYKFKWYGEWHALLRSKGTVEILKFYPDGGTAGAAAGEPPAP